jgi:hypothetical protein
MPPQPASPREQHASRLRLSSPCSVLNCLSKKGKAVMAPQRPIQAAGPEFHLGRRLMAAAGCDQWKVGTKSRRHQGPLCRPSRQLRGHKEVGPIVDVPWRLGRCRSTRREHCTGGVHPGRARLIRRAWSDRCFGSTTDRTDGRGAVIGDNLAIGNGAGRPGQRHGNAGAREVRRPAEVKAGLLQEQRKTDGEGAAAAHQGGDPHGE